MINGHLGCQPHSRTPRDGRAPAERRLGALVFTLCRALARLLVRTFYRRVEVVGLEHVPLTGPLLIAPTHPNGLVDSLLILATLPRHFVTVAAAPLFRSPVFGTLLRLLGALPAHRHQDGDGEAPGRRAAQNADTVAHGIAALSAGRAVLLFPEGTSHSEPRLRPLKTGAARMVLGAAATRPSDVTLLPVGLVYHRPTTFRAGAALVRIGPPVPLQDLLAPDGSVPTGAVHALTVRLTGALRALSLQAGDRDTLALLGLAEACWRAEDPTGNDHLAGRVAWMGEALDVARRLPARDQPRVETLRHRLARFQEVLARAALGPRSLSRTGPPGRREPCRTREALLLLVELPFVVGGWLRHLLPFLLTGLLVRLARPEPVMEATWKLVGGLVLYPICWLLEALAAWALGGPWLLAAFLAWLVPGGFWLLAWHGRWARLVRQARGALWARRHRRQCDALLAERRAIVDDMRALAAVAARDEGPVAAGVAEVPAPGREHARMPSAHQGASR